MLYQKEINVTGRFGFNARSEKFPSVKSRFSLKVEQKTAFLLNILTGQWATIKRLFCRKLLLVRRTLYMLFCQLTPLSQD
jgi:hypothetical protein